jgi:hypothetical protein
VKRIPQAGGVALALREVRGAAQKALKGLNQAASQRMAKGDYVTAEALAAKGKEIQQFQAEADALRKRWREICGLVDRSAKNSATPLWMYYQPILQALVQAGGECRRTEVELRVDELMSVALQPVDREPMAHGRERWRVMVQRARKALVTEGWIEDRSGLVWRITSAGRQAAKKTVVNDSASSRPQAG